jgi:cyclopropane-fatty-acyl-phospholipid synthase
MANKSTVESITKLLRDEAGIEINGDKPTDIRVLNDEFWDMIIKNGSLGFGEAYMYGYWDCDDIEGLFYQIFNKKIDQKFSKIININNLIDILRIKLSSKKYDAFEVGVQHYDIGNDLYELMLGKTLAYSCGYFKNTEDLDIAQYQKFDLICRKLKLQKGETLLDIGCGWGGLMQHAVKHYGVKAVGLTVSKEQKIRIENWSEVKDISVYLEEYKEFDPKKYGFDKFDKIVSVGMFEHVNRENYDLFMSFCNEHLKDGGLFLLHTIGDQFTSDNIEPWIMKYIFPNSKLPSPLEVVKSSEKLFVLEDWQNFGLYYHKTLQKWWQNFEKNWENNLKDKYDKGTFYRMWKFYLKSTSAAFKSKHIHLWQIVYSKNLDGLYESVR